MKSFCNLSLGDAYKYIALITQLANLLRWGALRSNPVLPELRPYLVLEWCRRFHFYGDEKWQRKSDAGFLAAELRDALEKTQQLAQPAPSGKMIVGDTGQIRQEEVRNHCEPVQLQALITAKGCIERTVNFASVVLANLDAMLQSDDGTNDVRGNLRSALDSLGQELPAVTDVFTSEIRDKVLGLAHCAQIDGVMRIREVREMVKGVKVALETLLENLDTVTTSTSALISSVGEIQGYKRNDGDVAMADSVGN